MAVGDVVSSINISSYQPSSGVEVILLHIFFDNVDEVYRINNGTLSKYNRNGTSATSIGYMASKSTMKFPISNTNYFTCDSTTAISGIQIK